MSPFVSRVVLCSLLTIVVGCAPMASIDSRISSLDLSADTYIVRAGESLDSIAYRYQIPRSELVALNPGVAAKPMTGTAIRIRPGSTPAESTGIATAAVSELASPVVSNERERVYTSPTTVSNATRSPDSTTFFATENRTDVVIKPIAPEVSANSMNDASGPVEIVEEVYVHKGNSVQQQAVGQQLQSYDGQWTWPTVGHVARGFAPKTEGRHGVDIAGLPGQPVVAAHAGTVWFTGRDPSGTGNIVIVKHDDDLLTAYSHIEEMLVSEKQAVRAGDQIATLGANSRQESVLRFEVRKNGNPLNPMDFLQE